MPDRVDQFHALPKVELHLHLEGAIRPLTVEELAHRFDPTFRLADWEWTRPGFRFADLGDFVATMRRMLNVALAEVGDYARVAGELLHDLADENVVYAEPSVSMNRFARTGLDVGDVLRAIHDARLRAEEERAIRVGVIVAFGWSGEVDFARACAKHFAAWRAFGVVGIDLPASRTPAQRRPTPTCTALLRTRDSDSGRTRARRWGRRACGRLSSRWACRGSRMGFAPSRTGGWWTASWNAGLPSTSALRAT